MSDIDMSRRNTAPRPLSDKEKVKLEEFIDLIHYSARYNSKHPFQSFMIPRDSILSQEKE